MVDLPIRRQQQIELLSELAEEHRAQARLAMDDTDRDAHTLHAEMLEGRVKKLQQGAS
jgi:flagellar biogenesis protein FliO